MGRNITIGIPETISPRGINETICGKNSREKRDFTKSGKGSFLEDKVFFLNSACIGVGKNNYSRK